ncbi:glycosylphosphatidylinositol anchor biosynthesis [Paecilomyces lecythidis]
MAPLPNTSPPFPPPVPVETHPNRAGGLKHQRTLPDPSRLAPEDAYYAHSPPRLRSKIDTHRASYRAVNGVTASPSSSATLRPPAAVPSAEAAKELRSARASSRRRRRKGAWKKLLWVKQSYPDNYTDTETFLDHLQRNPRLRPYDFWPLVADSTVIVQHVCSVVIFVCCFVGIVQERVSPVTVVSWGSVGTVLGWFLWDYWVWMEQEEVTLAHIAEGCSDGEDGSSSSSAISSSHQASAVSQENGNKEHVHGLGLNISASDSGRPSADSNTNSRNASTVSLQSSQPFLAGIQGGSHSNTHASYEMSKSLLISSRNRQRLTTVKSAMLIYCALLGLSPILKSLTKSTASDSIWALSCWLMIINIFSFDYGSGEGAGATKFPASLSTNAALMASTVLASRLPSTTHVFSLTLFSIEVFGLFPVFRRQLRHISWTGHLLLTFTLVIAAGGGVGVTLRGGGWTAAIVGSILGSILTALAMGGCSWWLISLQKYKNVVTGPWDPARPILRRHWD